MNSRQLRWHLATSWSSPYRARTQVAVVPNVSWSMLPWEADLLVCSKAGFLTEVEIKVSMADWKADFLKKKFVRWNDSGSKLIKYFYYAAPEKLACRYVELQLPAGSGVISVTDTGGVKMLRRAEARPGHRRLTDVEIQTLCRLGAIKAWDSIHHPEFREPLVLEPMEAQ